MIEITTLIKNISSNYIRAQQAELDGNDKVELKYLLFAVQDIIQLLKQWNYDLAMCDTEIDNTTARKYAESLHHSAERIRELVMRAKR